MEFSTDFRRAFRMSCLIPFMASWSMNNPGMLRSSFHHSFFQYCSHRATPGHSSGLRLTLVVLCGLVLCGLFLCGVILAAIVPWA